jgi:ribokinase
VLLNAAPARDLSASFAALVDILVVNAVEAEMMEAGHVCCLASATQAAEVLAKRFDTVVVTAGGLGLAAWTSDDQSFALAAEKVTVVSTHGAGDAFIGALAASLMAGEAFEASCRAASRAAARHVSTPVAR